MTIGFYPGSFDPFTVGHLEIVKKASDLFDKVYVGIGINPDKKRHFDTEEMKKAIEESVKEYHLDNVEVIIYDNLTSDKVKELKADYIIRGIRNNIDYNSEETLAQINYELTNGIDTLYLRAGKYGYVSSSFVRNLMSFKKRPYDYLPMPVGELVRDGKYKL